MSRHIESKRFHTLGIVADALESQAKGCSYKVAESQVDQYSNHQRDKVKGSGITQHQAPHRWTLLANDSNTRKERWMPSLSSHQASEATAPQLATWPSLPPGIQADEIERHRTADLLQVDRWLPSRACLSRVQAAHRLGHAAFPPTAQPILVPIRVIALP